MVLLSYSVKEKSGITTLLKEPRIKSITSTAPLPSKNHCSDMLTL